MQLKIKSPQASLQNLVSVQVAAEIHNFQKSLQVVHLMNPSGTMDDNLLSMGVSIRIEKIEKMLYDLKNLDHDVCFYISPYKVRRNTLKFIYQMKNSVNSCRTNWSSQVNLPNIG